MKAILITFIFCFAFFQSASVKNKSDREHDGFVGNVKKAFEEWSPISGYPSYLQPGTRYRGSTRIYDADGRLLQSSVYPGAGGSDELRDHYTYDKDGARMSRTEEIRGENSPPPPPPPMPPPGSKEEKGPPKTVFQYDSRGRKIETAVLRAGGTLVYKLIYKYDEKDRLQESQNADPDGKITSRRVYSYEGDQRYPKEYVYIGSDGKTSSKVTYTEYELNPQGDWIKRKSKTESSDGRTQASLNYRSIDYHQIQK